MCTSTLGVPGDDQAGNQEVDSERSRQHFRGYFERNRRDFFCVL